MSITLFLDSAKFDPETNRVMAVAFEMACAALQLGDLSRRWVVAFLEAQVCERRFEAGNQFGNIFWLKRNITALKQCMNHVGHARQFFWRFSH